ncbi:hypothetical protein DL766_001009 [Monosporascus sp. MC13-8B]|uniref:LrgB-like protein n=1 Tax=Monosporascus cannonballus TaxID=155416 RepID=A0ABY0H6Q1_9PEZI|nr:hypothetical protein DL762_004768 [Monosporascus cannonballus]RYP38300.1 hypothetical protein DL766_001009 [Monosporascus sp. MC13-8B]
MKGFLQQLCKSALAPASSKRYTDFGIGVLAIVLNQSIVLPIQIALDKRDIDVPASILVMVFVFLSMAIGNHIIHGGVARFYTAHLQGPTDFLGRHMSLGFVTPFVMLNRDHISKAVDVPRIAGAFVLLTSGFGTVYFWIKSFFVKTTIDQVITSFRRHRTLAEAVIHISEDHNPRAHIGAGDLSCMILDAGILCLGMKMFEYRHELASSFYSIVSTCAIIATTSIFANVAIARRIGLESDEALAFAAKSVTIALGVPTMQKVNGSMTLMSALCIFSGMLFQMSGDYLFKILRINDRNVQMQPRSGSGSDTEKGTRGCPRGDDRSGEETKVVAAGVTVGVNAAAMGTAHLIERDSKAIAYSALSMTIFGGMTVALTVLPGVSDLLVFLASR